MESFKDYHKRQYKEFYDLFQKYEIDYENDVGQKGEYLPFLLERFILLGNAKGMMNGYGEGFDSKESINYLFQLLEKTCYKLFELQLQVNTLSKPQIKCICGNIINK
jgi:hypothetical protein